MNSSLRRYATPVTLGLFAISAVSGVALFFHTGQDIFHAMHEWLSLVLLLPFGLHVWKNWAPLAAYARQRVLVEPLAACLIAAVFFAVPAFSGTGRSDPPSRAMRLLTEAPLSELATMLKTTPDDLRANLARHGFAVAAGDDSLAKIAASDHVPATRVLVAVLPGK